MPRCSLMSMGTPFFISKLKFSYDKYSVDKVWTKIYCGHFYFRGITLNIIFAALTCIDSRSEKSTLPQEPQTNIPYVTEGKIAPK